MSRITWDDQGKRYYETGVDRGVLFVASGTGYGTAVPWNGLISVTETPSGGEPTPIWADNMKYLNLYSAEDFAASLECYTMPKEFEECDGTAGMVDGSDSIPGIKVGMQNRKSFALCYRTLVGNDQVAADANGSGDYKLHFIWGCKATPSERSYQTVNDSPEAITFSYELSTTPVEVTGMKPTAIITIDTRDLTDTQKTNLAVLEDYVYGTNGTGGGTGTDGHMPSPAQILSAIKSGTIG
jgi:hypothetical protein